MAKKDHAWMLLPQEDTGTYQFNGQFERVIKGKKERILLIDELNREMIRSGKHGFRDNFCRMIFDYEYHKMD